MRTTRCKTIFELCVYLLLPVGQAVCPYKECLCHGHGISCSDKHLHTIPNLVTGGANSEWVLNFENNNISRILGGSLPANITEIDMSGNPITTIEEDAFNGSVNTLASLTLSGVGFTQLPNAFVHLRALSILSLTAANMTDWNDTVWETLGHTLQILILDNVGMTTWPMWIQYCTKLTDLSIGHASFSTIPDTALDSLAGSLLTLSLENTRLTMVPKAMSRLTSLLVLHIDQNYITDITWLPHSPLEFLSLTNNYISNASHLSQVLRPFNSSMNALYMQSNLLTSIPELSFFNIRDLNFSHNRIHDADSGALNANTYSLDFSFNSLSFIPRMMSHLLDLPDFMLSNNNIKAISKTDFHSLVTLVDLGFNLITELTDASFPENFGLSYLHLNNNPLTTISSVALQCLPHLYELNLMHTQLIRLPLGLSYLVSLVILDVTDSPNLVCTCMESRLASWTVALGRDNIRGNCGQTSVYDFFSTLSPKCPSH